MLKRWLLRGLFLLPVVLCLAGWGWSGWYEGWVGYTRSHRTIGFGTAEGTVSLGAGRRIGYNDGYAAAVDRSEAVRFWPTPDPDDICFLGFRWWHDSYSDFSGGAGTAYSLTIPYWFPLLASALLFLLVWRKTRRRLSPATGFPVEVRRARDTPGGQG